MPFGFRWDEIKKRNHGGRRLEIPVFPKISVFHFRVGHSKRQPIENSPVVTKKPHAPFRSQKQERFPQIERESDVAEIVDGPNEEIDGSGMDVRKVFGHLLLGKGEYILKESLFQVWNVRHSLFLS